MRIVYFLPDTEGGVARVVRNLLQYRPQNPAIKYAVVLFSNLAEQHERVANDFKADEVVRFTFRPEENAWTVFRRMSKLLHSEKDIVVGNDGFEIKMVAALKLKNPVVYILHGDFDYYYSIVRQYQGVINHCIAISNTIEQKLQSIITRQKQTHTLISKIYFPFKPGAYTGTIKTKNSGFMVLFAGSLEKRKGADLLPAIYSYLSIHINCAFKLEVIGAGVMFTELKETFKDCANVSLSGWRSQDEVQQKMRNADVLLFPSRAEGLPNVLLEALSAGCVPVCSALASGVSDIIRDKINGLLVPPGDAILFGEAINLLASNKILLSELKVNGGKFLPQFNAETQAMRYEEVILSSVGYPVKVFPKYRKGRLLDESWLPGYLVKSLRLLIKNPKL